MKRMKKIIGCLVGGLLTAEAWAGGTLTLGSHVFTQGDSLHIELLLNLSDAKAGNAEAYLFTLPAICLLTVRFIPETGKTVLFIRYPLPIAHGWNTLHWC